MSRVLAVLALLLSFGFASAAPALAQPQPGVVITAPANGATVAGPDVTITIQVTGTTLVPAASATRLEDLHVHYMLDADPAPYLSGATPIPAGDPNIVHSGALSNTFAGVAPGAHRVAVVLGLSNHTAVQPPVAPAVSFTVAGVSAPAQLPRTGDASDPSTLLLATGVCGVLLGLALRGLARRRLRLGHGR
jgi:LPXTG-motif cell wall-anchored protein